MNPVIKKRWLKALRSGEYVQSQGCLHDNAGYCCLGVLTDLFLKEKGEEWSMCEPPPGVFTSTGILNYYAYGEVNYLPEEVQEWAGLHSKSPTVVMKESNHDNKIDALAYLNDSGKTFQQIAQIIEEQL